MRHETREPLSLTSATPAWSDVLVPGVPSQPSHVLQHRSSVWVSVSSWRVQQFGGFHDDSVGLEECRTQDQRTHLENTSYPVQADWFWSLTLEKQRPVPEFLKEKQGRFPERCSFGFVPIKIVLRVALAVEARSGG
ncbi:hypothetical protein Bbelb_353050 [Branchiostoma belcheri]|nr:hypothetical protein Bbelb_353050 [Branchiostoma belcheri]